MKRTVHVNQETVHALLPSIPPDFERDMRDMIQAMPAERKELPMRKKLSVGLILVLASLLLAGCALAATLLGGKDFVDHVVAPKAAESDSSRFTQEEVQEILRIARENELTLDDDIEQRLLDTENGYYKEELMRLFVKQEYGRLPGAWPIEVQHWYDEMLNACGQGDGYVYNVLPAEGEITQEEALQIAYDYICQHWEKDPQVEDKALYTRFLSYTETVVNPHLTERQWILEYQAKDLYHSDYRLFIAPDGTVKEAVHMPSSLNDEWRAFDADVGSRIDRKYENEYGAVIYTTDYVMEYQDLLRQFVMKHGDERLSSGEKHILNQTYLKPDSAMITAEEAIARAKEACGDLEWASMYRDGETAICMQADGRAVWKVTLRIYDQPNRAHWTRVWAQLDAHTGDVLYCDTAADTPAELGGQWRWSVTEEYWAAHRPVAEATPAPVGPAATPRPDGMPSCFGDETMAPAWYWERLEQVGFTNETAGKMLTEWENTYGRDTKWWPLEAQAVYDLHFNMGDIPPRYRPYTVFCGLPGPEDLPREQAERIARDAFTQAYGEQAGLTADQWLTAAHFYFHSPDSHTNSWSFEFVQPDTNETVGFVSLNSVNGEINGMTCGDAEDPFILSGEIIATPTPQPDGKPWMWGLDFAPPAFWHQLEETMAEWGVTFDNIEEKATEWRKTYADGELSRQNDLWPIECEVMYHTLCGMDPDCLTNYIPFPKADGITREQAVEIAWPAFREQCDQAPGPEAKAIVTPEWQAEMIPFAMLYHDDEPDYHGFTGTRWVVQFMHWEGDAYETRGWVYIDEDGNVMMAELELFGNG